MRQLSAIDAIGPAWNHTQRLLLAPRRWTLLFKIGLVAVFAGVGGFGGSFGRGGNNFSNMGHTHNPSYSWPPQMMSALVAVAALAIFLVIAFFILGLILFYIGSRLQFVLFEVVLRNDTTIAPIWNRYGAATWRWIGLRLAVILATLVCIAPVLIPAIIRFIHALPHHGEPPQHLAAFFLSFLGLFATIFFVALLFGIVHVLLHDFGLPSMALESTTLDETVRRVVRLVRAEPGQSLLYLVMRLLLNIAGSLCASFAIGLSALLALIPFGGVALVDWLVLHNAGMGGKVIMIAGLALLGVLYLALLFIAIISVMGYVGTFLQAYALYFLGGRYPLVGAYLEPFLPPPVTYYPPAAYGLPPTP